MALLLPRAVLALALLVASCAPLPEAQRLEPNNQPVPDFSLTHQPRGFQTARANSDIAQDLAELTFQMENGRSLPILSRFERPISLALAGSVPASVNKDLDELLVRLRREAGIDISRTTGSATITVEFIRRAKLQAVVPQAACFVVPNVASWAEYRQARLSPRVDWAGVVVRRQAAVFIPLDTSPQEIRDCLHEEIAQAIGPLNDLYRLSDSIFNDDNFRTTLTPFDMLILRTIYAPELASGMGRAEVLARVPGILARLHPQGEQVAGQPASPTPRAWIDAVERALATRGEKPGRRLAAERAVAIAQQQGWSDGRMAFSLFIMGRLSLSAKSDQALVALTEAGRIYQSLPEAGPQLAHVDLQLAAIALASGRPEEALALTNRALAVVSRSENAALMASFLLIKSEALDQLGRPSEGRAVRLDSRSYARYGFGPETETRARQSEIAGLTANQG